MTAADHGPIVFRCVTVQMTKHSRGTGNTTLQCVIGNTIWDVSTQ